MRCLNGREKKMSQAQIKKLQKEVDRLKRVKPFNARTNLKNFIRGFARNVTVGDIVDATLYTYLAWKSTRVFKKREMFWWGPLAYKLARTPGGGGEASTVSILGASFSLPSSQQVGLLMFGGMGLISIADFFGASFNASKQMMIEGLTDEYSEKTILPPTREYDAVTMCKAMKEDPLYFSTIQDLANARVDLLIAVNTNDNTLFTEAQAREEKAMQTLNNLSIQYGCTETQG